MIIKKLKIQMLAGNSLKMCFGAGFEISLTLVSEFVTTLTKIKNLCLSFEMCIFGIKCIPFYVGPGHLLPFLIYKVDTIIFFWDNESR